MRLPLFTIEQPKHLSTSITALPTSAELKRTLPFVGSARPWRLVRYACVDWFGILACWLVMASTPNLLVHSAGIVLIAGRLQALGVILHDACHLPMRRMTPPLALVDALAGWPIGSSIAAMRYHPSTPSSRGRHDA